MKRALALTVAAIATLAACGSDGTTTSNDDPAPPTGDSPAPSRTIEVSMTDMAFAPAAVDAAAGETVMFVFRNDGAVRHEAVFGDLAAQEEHHAEMASATSADHDGMDMDTDAHDSMTDLHSVIVEPGDSVEVVHTFGDTATMVGCHEPGHWEAGMKMTLDVS